MARLPVDDAIAGRSSAGLWGIVVAAAVLCASLLLVLRDENQLEQLLEAQQRVPQSLAVLNDVRTEARRVQQLSRALRGGQTLPPLGAGVDPRQRVASLDGPLNGVRNSMAAIAPVVDRIRAGLRVMLASENSGPDSMDAAVDQLGRDIRRGERLLRADAVRINGEVRYTNDRIGLTVLLLLLSGAAVAILALWNYRRRLQRLRSAYLAAHLSEERYARLLNAANEGILIVGRDAAVRAANRRFSEITGVDADELTGSSLDSLARQHSHLMPLIRNAIGQCEPHGMRAELLHLPDQPARWLSLECRRGADDEDTIVILEDVTRLRDAEFFHTRATRHFEALLNGLPLAVISLDLKGELLNCNPAWLKLFGVAGVGPDSHGDVVPTFFREHLAAAQSRDAGDLLVHEEQLEFRRTDGALLHIGVWTAPLLDPGGRIVGIISVCEDISERVMLDQARQQQDERRRRALIREVHHRAKNSLQRVIGLLSESSTTSEQGAALLAPAIARVQSIALFHGVMAARSDGAVEASALLIEVGRQVATSLGASVVVDTGGSTKGRLAVRAADAEALAVVVGELVTNAVKHGRYEAHHVPQIHISVQMEADAVCARISNPGTMKGRVQEPDEVDTAGIGLDLARALLPADGATLRFMNQRDRVVAEVRLVPPLIAALA